MYVNSQRFAGEITVIGSLLAFFALVLLAGLRYGLWTIKAMGRLAFSVKEITDRSYLPVEKKSGFYLRFPITLP